MYLKLTCSEEKSGEELDGDFLDRGASPSSLGYSLSIMAEAIYASQCTGPIDGVRDAESRAYALSWIAIMKERLDLVDEATELSKKGICIIKAFTLINEGQLHSTIRIFQAYGAALRKKGDRNNAITALNYAKHLANLFPKFSGSLEFIEKELELTGNMNETPDGNSNIQALENLPSILAYPNADEDTSVEDVSTVYSNTG